MEILAAVLTSLLGLGGAPGFVIDKTATDLLRGQLFYAEQLEVRVDNTPNFQILQGRVDRIRVAGRGVYPLPILRIQAKGESIEFGWQEGEYIRYQSSAFKRSI